MAAGFEHLAGDVVALPAYMRRAHRPLRGYAVLCTLRGGARQELHALAPSSFDALSIAMQTHGDNLLRAWSRPAP